MAMPAQWRTHSAQNYPQFDENLMRIERKY